MNARTAALQERFEAATFLHRTGRLEEAAGQYRALLAEAPHVAQLHYNVGLVLRGQGDITAAAISFGTAVRLRPDMAEAHVNLANSLYALGELDAAERACREGLRLDPLLIQAHANLGNILRDQGRLDESAAAFETALQRWPGDEQLQNNFANTLKALGRLDAAEATYRSALQRRPGDAELLYNLGTLHLLAGRLAKGWPGYEHRWQAKRVAMPPVSGPQWTGPHSPGPTLIYAEQGMGDAIQFCRYVPLVAAHAPVTFMVAPALQRLMGSLHARVTIITGDDPVPPYASQSALHSLPIHVGTTLASIPAATPYLYPEPEAVAQWRARLAPLGGVKVGIVWAGNPGNETDRRRSIAFDALAGLFARPGVQFVSLQKGAAAQAERQRLRSLRIVDWTDSLNDFADTAALISALDLVIGVDTAMIHLAGALGKPAWLMNRFDTDWRWLLGRDDSPWYPAMRLFRQPHPGDWADVIARVSAALDALVGQ